MTTYANSNLNLSERATYALSSFGAEELAELLAELDAYREINESPEELAAMIEELESNQANPDHADYDDLKEFFADCVSSLNKDWPCAEAYDQDLRQVICAAITKGDTEEEAE
jgi:hypothetical protein